MTGARHPDDQRGHADRGTELGSGTRLLASAFRLPVRAVRAVARSLRAVVSAIGSAVAVVTRPIGHAIAFVATHIARGVGYAATRVGHAIRLVAVPIGHGFALVATHVGHAIAFAATHVGHAIAFAATHVGHAIAFVATHVGHAIRLVAVPIGHAIATAAVGASRAIRSVAVPIGHAIAFLATRIGRAIAFLATRIGRALAHAGVQVGHAIAFLATHVGHAIAFVAVPIGHALALVGRAIERAATAAFRALGRFVTALLTPVGRAIARAGSAVCRVVLIPIGRAIAAFGTAFGRVFNRIADRVLAFVGACARWIVARVVRMRHSVGVAAARARQSSTTVAATPVGVEQTRIVAPPPPFTAEVFHNEYLPAGGRNIDAVVTVTALADSDHSDDRVATAEVVLVDCSGSMGHPWRKIRAARAATVAAIDALPDGAYFAIVRANHDADVVYPMHGGLAIKDADTAAEARRAVQGLYPEGGTAMGRWLLVARDLLATAPYAIGHAILLTDGKNESESPEALATARRACRGRFQCDCRGVGTDWDLDEVRGIADELLGTVDIVADPADLAADFRAMAERAAAKRVDGVTLRVWTPAESIVRFIKQVSPAIEDLEVRAARVDARTVDYPTGAWSDESRDYHLSIELPEKPAGTEMLAARVSLIVGDRLLSKALVTATWTEDLELSTRIVPEVVHYTGQAELLGAVQDALEARRDGEEVAALARLGNATRLAYETGNEATLRLIAKVVDIEDAPTGRVTARAYVQDADVMALETRSTRTTRFSVPIEPVHTVSSD